MYWGVVGSSLRVWFGVVASDGTPRTGLTSDKFTITTVAPDDSASVSATVSESTQRPGLYYFDIPGSFFTTYGPDTYSAYIQVSDSAPLLNASGTKPIKVTQEDIDTLGTNSELLRKLATNRMEQTSGNPGQLVLFDDDNTTPLKTWEIRDEYGNGINPQPNVPARRGAAT
jgi:hypothetical protein